MIGFSMNKIFYIIIFIIACTYPFEKAHAKQNIDYTKLESIGLLQTGDKQSLGADLYRHANRSELVYLLKNINRTPWHTLQNVIKNLLITAADSKVINNDTKIYEGNDLLTLRITALMRMGYNKEAFELYDKASIHNLSEPLIRAGIFSMLLNKQKARACLEVKTSFESHKDIKFWKEMNAYCMISLSKTPAPKYVQIIEESEYNILKELIKNDNYNFIYDPKSFSNLSFIERSILIADDKITVPDADFSFYKNIPAQHISQLISQSNLSDSTKIAITSLAIKYGYIPPKTLSNIYNNILEKYKNSKPKDNDWYRLAKIYKDTKSGWIQTKKRKEKISEAFTIAQKHDISVLIPLLPTIVKMEIDNDLSIENAQKVLPLLNLLNINNTYSLDNWIKNLTKLNYDEGSLNNIRLNLLTALQLMTNIKSDKVRNIAITSMQKYLSSSQYKLALKNIIENIDSSANNSDKLRYIGINGFDLIWNKRYTMPPYIILKALNKSSKNQDISVSLLLSAHILNNIDNNDLYVGTISDVIDALNDLGFKQLSHLILAQAILQMEN